MQVWKVPSAAVEVEDPLHTSSHPTKY
jgi:hypothetical protein